MVFSETGGQPKSMKLNNFNWSANDLSRKFQGSKSADHFIAKFLELFGNTGDQSTGDQSTEAVTSAQPPKKRARLSVQSHKALMPATRKSGEPLQANEGDQSDDNINDQYEEASMDKLIHDHFRGLFCN